MSSLLWIRNGRVIDPANKRDAVGDVFVRDGKIVATPEPAELVSAQVYDATDKVVAPGLVDIHVHFREPGQTHKEDIGSGSRAAAAGGFTSVVCMPNTQPVADNPGTIQRIKDAALRHAIVNVYPTGCLTLGMKGEELAPIGSLRAAGVVAVTDDGLCVQNNEVMRRAVEYARMFGLVVMDHCQDASMTKGAVMNDGYWSLKLGLKGWPAAAEDLVIARNIVLAEFLDAHIHMQHVSSAGGVELLRRAKRRGVKVTGEATPHHFYFTDACCQSYDTNFKMNPPLRTEVDRLAIIEGLLDGTLDIIATDHAPHTADEKDCEFDYAPFGIIGLETALGASLEVLYHSGKLGLSEILSLMTHKPAAIVGLNKGTLSEGADADIVVLDPNQIVRVDAFKLQSKSSNCPWHGHNLRGKVLATFVSGRLVWDGKEDRIVTH